MTTADSNSATAQTTTATPATTTSSSAAGGSQSSVSTETSTGKTAEGNAGTASTQQATGDGKTSTTQSADTTSTTNTTKTGDEGKTATEGDGKTAVVGAPETYEAFNFGDGASFSDVSVGKITEVAKGLNLNQEQAQKLASAAGDFQRQFASEIKANVAEQINQWGEQAKSDKEIGGDNFEVSVATANKAARTFGSPAFMQLLKDSGMERHPEVIRTFLKIGQSISPDTLINDGAPVVEGDTTTFGGKAKVMYGGKK